MNITTGFEIACAVVTVASGICAATPTPPPGTVWGRVYRGIEIAGLVVGRAKQRGLVPANPAIDGLAGDAVKVAGVVIGKAG